MKLRQFPRRRRLRLRRPAPGRRARRARGARDRADAPPRARQAPDPAADGRGGRGRRRATAHARAARRRPRRGDQPRRHPAQPARRESGRTTTDRISRGRTSSSRRRWSTPAAKPGVKRLLHMSALGADPKAPSEYLRSKGVGEDAGARRGRPRGHRVPALGDLRARGPVPQPVREAHALAPGARARLARGALPAGVRRRRGAAMLASLDRPRQPSASATTCAARTSTRCASCVEYVCAITGRTRLIIGLPDSLSFLQAWAMEFMPAS